MINIFQINVKIITHNEVMVVEEVVEDVGVIMTDMMITTDTIIMNMTEVAEDAEETGGATGAGVEVTEAMGAGVEIGVVVEAEVDTKMTTHNEDVGVEEDVEDVGVIMTVMMVTITAMAIMNLKHPLLYNTRYALIFSDFFQSLYIELQIFEFFSA